jgi:hypothetical protein
MFRATTRETPEEQSIARSSENEPHRIEDEFQNVSRDASAYPSDDKIGYTAIMEKSARNGHTQFSDIYEQRLGQANTCDIRNP